jgi:hypothetical protein
MGRSSAGGLDAVGREEAGGGGRRGEVRVEAEDHVGLGPRTFEPEAGKERRAVACRDELEIAAAGRLEGGLHRGAWAPFGHEAVVGVDGEDRGLGRDGRGCQKSCRKGE